MRKTASSRPTADRPKQKCQTACKPGSVPPEGGDDHSSGPPIAERFSRPTRTPRAVNPASEPARRPYSVLLQAGLAMPPTLPPTRWALTPPFHPSPGRSPGGLLSVALSLGSPRAGVTRRLFTVEPGLSSTRASSRRDRPAVWRGLSARERGAGQRLVSPSPSWGGWLSRRRSRVGALQQVRHDARSPRPTHPVATRPPSP